MSMTYHHQPAISSDPHSEKAVFVDILLQVRIREGLFLLDQEAEGALATVEGLHVSTGHSSSRLGLLKHVS
jgi:hypothetical protein